MLILPEIKYSIHKLCMYRSFFYGHLYFVELQNNRIQFLSLDGTSVLDCKFQDLKTDEKTTCVWQSTTLLPDYGDYGDIFDDWRAVNSGDGDIINHGATEQHLEGRGHIMTFDATGKADYEGSVFTPKIMANSNCSCTMRFLYLLRGVFVSENRMILLRSGRFVYTIF